MTKRKKKKQRRRDPNRPRTVLRGPDVIRGPDRLKINLEKIKSIGPTLALSDWQNDPCFRGVK